MARNVLRDYDDGFGFTETQQEQLGYAAEGREFGTLIYGQFVEHIAMKAGQLVRHAGSVDLLKTSETNVDTAGEGKVTTASAVGTNYLYCAGLFANKDWRGAVGYIYDGDGEGQTFAISNMIKGEADYVQVRVLAGNNKRDRESGWKEALSTSSRFWLWFHGKFYQGNANIEGNNPDRPAGFLLADVTPTADYQPYGYVVARGMVNAAFNQGGTDITLGEPVIAVSGGEVVGLAALPSTAALGSTTTYVENSKAIVGRALVQATGLGADELIPIEADLPIWSPSFATNLAATHTGNSVDIK